MDSEDAEGPRFYTQLRIPRLEDSSVMEEPLDELDDDPPAHVRPTSSDCPLGSSTMLASNASVNEPEAATELRRQEFKHWLLCRFRYSSKRCSIAMGLTEGQGGVPHPVEGPDERRQRRLEQLHDRLAAAERSRRQAWELKAAQLSHRRSTGDLARLHQERQELLSQKIYEGLRAAEGRRRAIREAANTRRRARRQQVLSRLALSSERTALEMEERRKRLELRLKQAEEFRNAKLLEAAARAEARAKKARVTGLLSRAIADQISGRRPDEETGTQMETPVPLAAEDALDPLLSERFHELRRRMSSRTLARHWRHFVRKRKTSAALAVAFLETGVTGWSRPSPNAKDHSSAVLQFEQFATALRAPSTLKTAQALLHRLEVRLAARGIQSLEAFCLLRRLFPSAPKNATLERYPARVFLCAYMVQRYPDVVFSKQGGLEQRLAHAGEEMLEAFEALTKRIVEPPEDFMVLPAHGGSAFIPPSPVAEGMRQFRERQKGASTGGDNGDVANMASEGSASCPSPRSSAFTTIGERLVRFDEAWMKYLDAFVSWKFEDAAGLERELIRMAVEMDSSMRHKCGGDSQSDRVRRSADLQAIVAQVQHDQGLLRERISQLAGTEGVSHLEEALEQARVSTAALSGTETETETEIEMEQDSRAAESLSHVDTAPHGDNASTPTTDTQQQSQEPAQPEVTTATATYSSAITIPAPPAKHQRQNGGPSAAVDVPTSGPGPTKSPSKPRGSGLALGFFNRAPKARAAPSKATPALTPDKSANPALPTRPPAPPLSGHPDGTHASGSQAGHPGVSAAEANGDGQLPDTGGVGSGDRGSSLPPSPSAMPVPRADAAGDSQSNMQLVWELLHNPSYQLPAEEAVAAWKRSLGGAEGWEALQEVDSSDLEAMSPDQLVALLKGRAKVLAEKAFWDNVTLQLESGLQTGGVAALAIPLLSEVATELSTVVPETAAASDVRQEFSQDALRARVTDSAGASTAGPVGRVHLLLSAVARLAELLLQWGAPAREAEAVAEQRQLGQVTAELLAAWAAASDNREGGRSSVAAEERQGGRQGLEGVLKQLAETLARALRMLSAQLRLLKLDAANARLMMLSRSLRGTDGAVHYLRAKFATLHGLAQGTGSTGAPDGHPPGGQDVPVAEPPVPATSSGSGITTDSFPSVGRAQGTPGTHQGGPSGTGAPGLPSPASVAAALPLTTQWLRATLEFGQAMSGYLQGVGIDLARFSEASCHSTSMGDAGSGGSRDNPKLPSNLRTGAAWVGAGALHRSMESSSQQGSALLRPVVPVSLSSWRGTVRAGVVRLVAGAGPAVSPSLAETFVWDSERLHAAQNDFQRVLVVAACLLLVGQYRSAAARGGGDGAVGAANSTGAVGSSASGTAVAVPWSLEQQTQARRQLMVVLADPGMRLPDLTTELARLAGATDLATEARLRTAFTSLMQPSSPAFRSIGTCLSAALLVHLLVGQRGEGAQASVMRGEVHVPRAAGSAADVAGRNGQGAAVVCTKLLSRIGGAAIVEDVVALGDRLGALVAANEAVHAEVYASLQEGIKDEPQSA